MPKLVLDDLANLNNQASAVTTINNNSNLIETALENTLSRDGTSPNSMGADFDMNSNDILNVASLEADTIEATSVEADNFTVDGVSLNILLIDWEGQWLTATAYAIGDVVYNNGSSYIAVAAHTSGVTNQPGAGVNWEDFWDLVAQKGDIGQVTSPGSTTDNALARWDGTDGSAIQNSLGILDDSGNLTLNGVPAVTTTGAQTLTNKTVNLANNTVTGTLAEFNTAVSDANLASLAGSETLTNKSIALGSNTISGTTAQFNTALSDNDFATLAGSETLTNKTLTNPTLSTSYMELVEISSPANPAANALRLFAKDNAGLSKIYIRDSAGTETELGSGGGATTTPTVQRFTSGSGTYTPAVGVQWIRVRMVGGGGGGGASQTNAGSAGGDTTFESWVAENGSGGGPGTTNTNGGAGGTGGASGTGTLVARFSGQRGGPSFNAAQNANAGGNSVFGGAGASRGATGQNAAETNTGSGGSGALNTAQGTGAGGGAGEYVEFIMSSAQIGASVSYAVGAGGAGGTAGSTAGGAGAAGIIIVEEHY